MSAHIEVAHPIDTMNPESEGANTDEDGRGQILLCERDVKLGKMRLIETLPFTFPNVRITTYLPQTAIVLETFAACTLLAGD